MTLIVMVDSPRTGGDTGGVIAAPIFKRIADASALSFSFEGFQTMPGFSLGKSGEDGWPNPKRRM